MVTADADVIIAGAGPAGSIAAYELSRLGIPVLILEKTTFPRYKVCGGGLTHKIIKEIPFDIAGATESVIHTIRFSANLKEVFSRTSPEPLLYCTMRSDLDLFLLEKATQAGAKVLFMQQVTEIKVEQDTVCVRTKENIFRSKLVIGADGPASIVARSLGMRQNIVQGLAWEAEIKTDPDILKKYSDTVFLDWGTFPGGYGWVFPKKDHFSVGVGGPAILSKQMMPYFRRFMEYLDFGNTRHSASSIQHPVTLSLKSWPISVRTQKGNFHSGRVLVAGDAAGLTDSLTGEGIYYAVRSGKLAASACSSFLLGQAGSLSSYSDRINDELMSELLEGRKIKQLFNAVPMRIHFFVRDSERAWRAFGKVLRGERNYHDVRLGFGKWKVFWNLACFISGYIEKIKTVRYMEKGGKSKDE
jgi:geranylgeranyl reductase family protein